MEIIETSSPSASIIALAGRLDGVSSPSLSTKIDALAANGVRRLIVDCTRISYVSSAGLRVLISAAKKLKSSGGSIALAAVPPTVYEVFELSGMNSLMEIHADVRDASEATPVTPKPVSESAPQRSPLPFVEEIVLLALDDNTGDFLPIPRIAQRYALAGAVICDLAWLNRIDTDPERLIVLSNITTSDPLLDRALHQLHASPYPRSVEHWLRLIADDATILKQAALDRLLARGILRVEENLIRWVLGKRRYPTLDQQDRIEVRTRLSALIMGNDLPDPRDAMLLGLLSACQLTQHIFAAPEFASRAARLAQLAKFDLVGREVANSIRAIAELRSKDILFGI